MPGWSGGGTDLTGVRGISLTCKAGTDKGAVPFIHTGRSWEVNRVVDGGQTGPVTADRTRTGLECIQTAETVVRYVVRVSREVAGAFASQGIGIINLERTFQTRASDIDLIQHLSGCRKRARRV
jgi:hypothetical protein